jgi:hypothetical protein
MVATNTIASMEYVGSELELFKSVQHWKGYFKRQIAPFIAGHVLEVGAGIGGTTQVLFDSSCSSWTCLEPDAALASQLSGAVASLRDSRGHSPEVRIGTIRSLPPRPTYDTLLYIDTLEHIQDDCGELTAAVACARPGAHLVVLSPAHPWLYTPFDRAIGHFRRYTKASLESCAPPGLIMVRLRYLDSVGICASLANRMLMRASMPTVRQLAIWDRVMVPVSRAIDPLTGFRLGKSIVAVWRLPT